MKATRTKLEDFGRKMQCYELKGWQAFGLFVLVLILMAAVIYAIDPNQFTN